MNILNQILQKLGIEQSTNLVNIEDKLWRTKVPYRLQKGLLEINPIKIYLQDKKPLILFIEIRSKKKKKEISEKIWNLGGSPVVIFIEESTLSVYNGFLFDKDTSCFSELLKNSENIHPENMNLNLWDIVLGKLWNKLKNNTDTKVDYYLLKNIESAQKKLVENKLDISISNNLIGRLIFVRYLLDRKIKIDNNYFSDNKTFLELIKNKKSLYKFFLFLKEKFNGDLFPIQNNECNLVKEIHLNILHSLFAGNEVETGQQSLFNLYNFNIIPIELLSEVYEKFMGDKKQRKDGAYYTPSFLADYIIQKTVKKHLENNNDCKVFDPSCGSGIFLVETLRSIIEKNDGSNLSIEKLQDIITKNIFGVDKNGDAVNVTIFSLYLTLLEYLEPKDISQNFKFPNLRDKNIFEADFFDLENKFNKKLQNINLDYILGNPPWASDKNNLHLEYIEKIKKEKNELLVSDNQLAQTFTLRTKDFSSKNTKCALVLTSKVLYNHNAKNFRTYFLENFKINEILELSSVRNQLFKGAKNPSVVVFYKYTHEEKIDQNIIKYTSVKPNIFLKYLGIITIEKNDKKEIQQDYFLKYDWLWKIMLYGNVFDFNLIKRLKDDFNSLNDVIEKNKFTFGQGLQIGGGDKNDASHLIGKIFLDTSSHKKALKPFLIENNNLKEWDKKEIHRPRDPNIFKAPYVLLKKGASSDLSVISAYSEIDYVFTDSVTAIQGSNKNILKNITGTLNSSFLQYFMLLQGSSIGTEREQGHNKGDRFTVPMVIDTKISQLVDKIQTQKQKLYNEFPHNFELENNIEKLEEQLNTTVLKSFELTKQEKRLIDYALTISIPVFNDNPEPHKSCTPIQLEEYSQLFVDHFGKKWKGENNNYFEIDIYQDDYIVGMNFKVVHKKPKKLINLKNEKNIMEYFSNFLNLGLEKITDTFFEQKDIRGFEKESFYIIKPNEYKNWHPAIAQGDLYEFIEKILDAGKRHLLDKNK